MSPTVHVGTASVLKCLATASYVYNIATCRRTTQPATAVLLTCSCCAVSSSATPQLLRVLPHAAAAAVFDAAGAATAAASCWRVWALEAVAGSCRI